MFLNVKIKKEDVESDIKKLAYDNSLSYGILDENNVLLPDRIRSYTMLYDKKHIGKGIEVFHDEHMMILELSLPADRKEIESFYTLIQYICVKEEMDSFCLNDQDVNLSCISDLIENAKKESEKLFNDYKMKEHVEIQGVKFPICLGKEILKIQNLNDFGNMLHEYQSRVTYVSPKTYDINDEKVGVFKLLEDERCVLPYEPYVTFLDDVKEYYLGFEDLNVIFYEDFLKEVKTKEEFDEKHFVVCLNEESISELVKKYARDIHTKDHIESEYTGKELDDPRHMHKVKDKNFPLEEIVGYNHMAIFLRWCLEHHMVSEKVLKEIPEIMDKNTDLREIIMNHELFKGYLRTIHFNDQAKAFVKDFYLYNTDGVFPHCVDLYAESYFGERYHAEEFDDEAYLFVPFDEAYYMGLSKYIDEAYEKFKEKKDEKE